MLSVVGIAGAVSILVLFCIAVKYGFAWFMKDLSKRYHEGKPSIWYNSFLPFHAKVTKIISSSLPTIPGAIMQRNFSSTTNTSFSDVSSLKIVTLNMEMGKKLEKIKDLLVDLAPDILCLQEVDICTIRNGGVDSLAELASVLEMESVFIPQTIFTQGCEGNAILSKFPIVSTYGIPLQCQKLPEICNKTHFGVFVVVESPWGQIGCCSVHIDTHCGIDGRIRQYKELLRQVQEQQQKHALDYQIIAGDFNTLCHGVTRLVSKCSPCWNSKIGTLGYTEAEWFQIHAIEKFNKQFACDFYDPFDKKKDTTVFVPGIYSGKLDWCLLSQKTMHATSFQVGSSTKMVSDHQWLQVIVEQQQYQSIAT